MNLLPGNDFTTTQRLYYDIFYYQVMTLLHVTILLLHNDFSITQRFYYQAMISPPCNGFAIP